MENLTDLIKAATSSPSHSDRVPGLAFLATDHDGKILNSTVFGVRKIDGTEPIAGTEPITDDSIFWIASMTKMVTGIALMQLVEQGRADLDSVEQVESVCPELKDVKILEEYDGKGKARLREKKNGIRLRLLSSHQSEHSYTFVSEDVWRFAGMDLVDEELSGSTTPLAYPLIFEPGTSHKYGMGVQWTAVFIERLTGMILEEYFKENIFGPLGLKDSSFVVSKELRERLVTLHRRDADASRHPIDPIFATLLKEKVEDVVCSGEGGLVSTASDFAQILAMMLNDRVSPTTNARILKKETIDLMFTNQVPNFNERFAGAGFGDRVLS